MNPDDNPFYVAKFIECVAVEPTRDSHHLMEKAYNYFSEQLRLIKDQNPSTWKDQFGAYSRFLDEQARIVLVHAPTDADAFAIFETLNDRGADLTISDLLKNLLFSRAKNEIDTVQQLWVEARTIIQEMKPRCDMMTFLRHYWSSRHGATRERELYKAIKGTINTQAEALTFAKTMREDASIYKSLLTPSDDFWQNYSQSSKLALTTFDRLNLEQIRPLLLALYRHFPQAEAERASKSILNWSVRGIIGGVIGGGKAETYFCDASIKIRNGSIKTTSELLDELKGFIPNDSLFKDAFERYRTNTNSFGRYIIHCVERKMMNEKEPELIPNQNVDELNLEHVLPQRAKSHEWPNFLPESVPVFAYRLGNMTLLGKTPNSKIGNRPFNVKKPTLAQSKLKVNAVFKTAANWNSSDIEARQKDFAKLAPLIWPR